MREPTTDQPILDEGRLEATREVLFILGTQFYGPPSEGEKNAILNISDPERLERMCLRLVTPANWRVLLNTP
jgi:hypothetical protein